METAVVRVDYLTADGKTYTITLTFTPDAEIPEDAELSVREIVAGTEEYETYLAQANAAMADDANLMAETEGALEEKKALVEEESIVFARFFDIEILVDGEKFEPKAPVQVSISYNEAINLESYQEMKVVHFANTGTEVIDVELTENEDGGTDVAFTQDSFSVSGTVVQYLSTGWPDNGNYVIIVKPYNSNNYYAVKNDGEITSVVYNSTTGKVTFSDLTATSQVSDYWWTTSNSSYNGWKYVKNGSNYLDPNSSTGLSTSADSIGRYYGDFYNVNYGYGNTYNFLAVDENGLKVVGQADQNANNRAVVFFANDFQVDETPDPGEDPSAVDLGAPGAGKVITSNNDGTYNLALSVTGKSQAQDKHSTADVLVVFDTSGSMNSTRMSTAKSAMRTLASALLANNTEEHPDTVRLKLLTFATVTRSKRDDGRTYYADFAWVTGSGSGASFNNGYSTFNNHLGQLDNSGTGGTNWEDALDDAGNVEMRSDAAKYIIFVSDGNPTFRNSRGNNSWNDYNQSYYNTYSIWGTGSDSNDTTVSHCYDVAKLEAKELVDAGINFYTIGVFGSVDRMKNLTAYAYSGSDSGTYPTGRYQSADADNIDEVFANIINDINMNFSYTDVEIDDGITALTATALVTGTVNDYNYKISYVDANDNQTKTVTVTKNADGTVSIPSVTYGVKGSNGTIKQVTTTAVTVKGATYTGSAVKWELDKSDGSNYKLENGWTYEVSFTVWPTQRAYDIVADLANGVISYNDLTAEEKASIDPATLTLKTNSEASVSYRQITTVDGVDQEPSDPKTVEITNPPGVALAGSALKIVKRWNDDLDPQQLLDLLTDNLNDAGTDVNYAVTLDVVQDKGTSAEEPVHTADYPEAFIFKPTVTIEGTGNDAHVTAATWPEIDIAVAPGIMMTYEHAHAHGFDTMTNPDGTPKYSTVTYNGVTYYVIEKGHRYEITERNTDYHFEMESNVDHLMIVDGVLKNVIFNDAGTQIIEISGNTADLTELTATNNLKGGINIVKTVEDPEGNTVTPKDAVFTVKCTILDKNGNPYTRTSETVGDDESNGIVYRVYAPDAELETLYPGKVQTGRNRTIKIGVRDSSEFTVQLKAGWTIRFINVPGNSTWEFEEVNIPAGYTLDTTKTIGMTGIAYVNTANNCSITNTQTSSDVTFKKKDFTTKAFVPGAVFELQRLVNGMYVKVDDVDGLTSDSTFTITSEAGVTLTLAPGSYKLIEKTSPDGYIIMTDEILFTVGDRLAITSETDLAEIDASDPTVMNLFNKVGQPLPNTGGPGNYLNYLGGIALLMTAAVMYGFRMRRRERRYN